LDSATDEGAWKYASKIRAVSYFCLKEGLYNKVMNNVNKKQEKLSKSALNYIVLILKRYGATKIFLFGSYARGDQHKESDLDVLVEFGNRITLIDLSHIIRIVKEETGIQLDIVTKNALSPHLAPFIEKDLKEIYLP
jgi:uncharacterized protein